MILNLAATLFVLGLTFLHSMYGLFSGIINLFCTIVALAIAFGFTEPLNAMLVKDFHLHSSYTEPLTLGLLFVISLLILRLAADNLVRGNMRIPMYVDWGGGAVCGFLIAQISVGVMVLSFVMLPWGDSVAGYTRIERVIEEGAGGFGEEVKVDPETGRVVFARNPLWLRSDQMAVGLFNIMSSGSLSTNTRFASIYPDFTEWVFWTRNTIQQETQTAPLVDERRNGFEQGIAVETWWEQPTPLPEEDTRYRALLPTRKEPRVPFERYSYRTDPGKKLIGVRLTLRPSSADRGERKAMHRFRPSMIRLVGDIVRGGEREPAHYVPDVLGGADPRLEDKLRVVDIDNDFSLPAEGDTQIDAFFEVDERFEPRFVEYRRHARANVSQGGFAKTPPSGALAAAAVEEPEGGARGSGAARFIEAVQRAYTGDQARLPVKLDSDRILAQAEVSGDEFVSGKVSGYLDRLSGEDADLEQIQLPDDGRIFQLQTEARKANSLLGQVFNFVGSRVNQYYAVDSLGEEYPLAGYYGVAERGGQRYIELTFYPDPAAAGFRHMLQWEWDGMIGALQDQEDALLGLYFVVPSGKEIVAVRAGRAGRIDFGGRTYEMQ